MAVKEQSTPTPKAVSEDDILHVKIYSSYSTFYDDTANSISATNDTGPFDVLPRHHNFITLVNPGEVTVRKDGNEDKRLLIQRGVMHVRNNKVTLFLDV